MIHSPVGDQETAQTKPGSLVMRRAEEVVRESFQFLLERESAASILPEFSLDQIGRYFPEFFQELPRRLT